MRWHVFNPENDLALACFDRHFIPPASARRMASDLSVLPACWAEGGDRVCVASLRGVGEWASSCGPLLPSLSFVDGRCLPPGAEVEPWGWSPLLVRRLSDAGVCAGALPDEATLARWRSWSHRRQAVGLLAWLRGGDSATGRTWGGRLCGESACCVSEADVVRRLAAWPCALLKAPWSGSGKGLRRSTGMGLVPPLSGWCRRVLREQGSVVVEPIYNKVYDLAMEFQADGRGRVDFEGVSWFATSHRGSYEGNFVAPQTMIQQWLSALVPEALWRTLAADLASWFAPWSEAGYRGPLGVDMMLCRAACTDVLSLHPCVEINLRRTMGWVALKLARLLAPGAAARFRVDFRNGEGEMLADHVRCLGHHPRRVVEGRLASGYQALTPVDAATSYRASLFVEPLPASFGVESLPGFWM